MGVLLEAFFLPDLIYGNPGRPLCDESVLYLCINVWDLQVSVDDGRRRESGGEAEKTGFWIHGVSGDCVFRSEQASRDAAVIAGGVAAAAATEDDLSMCRTTKTSTHLSSTGVVHLTCWMG